MSDPDPKDFSFDEKPNDYVANFSVRGSISVNIKADSQAHADRIVQEMLEDEEFGFEIDDVDDVELDCVKKHPKMYRVWDGDKKMQVSRLKAGMLPRDPDERGF